MRGEITEHILNFIMDGVTRQIDIFEAILESGYGASFYKLQKAVNNKQRLRDQKSFERQARINFRNRLSVLKKDGVIEKEASSHIWSITQKGKTMLNRLKKEHKNIFPPTSYVPENSSEMKIIIFDIPETERKKRDWLRRQFYRLGFTLLQKSVWIGKKKIPEQFVKDLHRIGIFDYVEIFSITKQGTIKKLE